MRYYDVFASDIGKPGKARPRIKAKNLVDAKKIAKKKYPNKVVHVFVSYTKR